MYMYIYISTYGYHIYISVHMDTTYTTYAYKCQDDLEKMGGIAQKSLYIYM